MKKMKFKVGDFVKVLPLEDVDKTIHNWQGQIKDIYDPFAEGEEEDDVIITISLDAQSLSEMDEEYIFNEMDLFDDVEELDVICCNPSDLEIASRRDTDELREKAIERLFEIAAKYEDLDVEE